LIVPRRAVFLDTSYILALENKDDAHHDRALALENELLRENAALLLHWGILFEIADGYARIARRARGLQLLDKIITEEGYRICPITESLFQDALGLYRGRPDKDWGLTDCLSFVLMKQQGIAEALSADVHFRQAGFTALLLETS
jgi:predicted nucleic acid-binding protein